jgi:mono/diheme cytochrome c family protein
VWLLIRSSLLNNPRPRRAAAAATANARGIAALAAAALGTAAPVFAAEPGAAAPAAAVPGDGSAAGAAVFADRCAVCHGPTAAGIPRSFPSLHEQVVAFAKIPQGRDYLVMVVTTGLMGSLTVGGVNYNGVMPAQTGLSEAQVAAVLNYLASGLGENESGARALSPTDVADARARHADKSAQATRALRPATDL